MNVKTYKVVVYIMCIINYKYTQIEITILFAVAIYNFALFRVGMN